MSISSQKQKKSSIVPKVSITVTLLTVLSGTIISAQQNNQPTTPYIIGITHLHTSITVWSDGTLDVSDAVQLTARKARRLANRLEDAEHNKRQRARINPIGTTTRQPGGNGIRCQAIAASTGKQCRNNVQTLPNGDQTRYCAVHNTVGG